MYDPESFKPFYSHNEPGSAAETLPPTEIALNEILTSVPFKQTVPNAYFHSLPDWDNKTVQEQAFGIHNNLGIKIEPHSLNMVYRLPAEQAGPLLLPMNAAVVRLMNPGIPETLSEHVADPTYRLLLALRLTLKGAQFDTAVVNMISWSHTKGETEIDTLPYRISTTEATGHILVALLEDACQSAGIKNLHFLGDLKSNPLLHQVLTAQGYEFESRLPISRQPGLGKVL